MINYDYKKAKRDVETIFNNKTDITKSGCIPIESNFNYGNGIKTWVASIFVDIVDSTSYFLNNSLALNVKSRIIRAFIEQLVSIINGNEHVAEIGIRGDCVYGVFDARYKTNLLEIFRTAYCINTFINMFNKILDARSWPNLKAGIGLSCDEDLIIKVGAKRIISDKVWLGNALFNASTLSKIANRKGYSAICMDSCFYNNVIELLLKENRNYSSWITRNSSNTFSGDFYDCDIVQSDFDSWIRNGMR